MKEVMNSPDLVNEILLKAQALIMKSIMKTLNILMKHSMKLHSINYEIFNEIKRQQCFPWGSTMASDWLSQFGDLGPFFHINVVALLLPPSPRIPFIIHPRPHRGMRFVPDIF